MPPKRSKRGKRSGRKDDDKDDNDDFGFAEPSNEAEEEEKEEPSSRRRSSRTRKNVHRFGTPKDARASAKKKPRVKSEDKEVVSEEDKDSENLTESLENAKKPPRVKYEDKQVGSEDEKDSEKVTESLENAKESPRVKTEDNELASEEERHSEKVTEYVENELSDEEQESEQTRRSSSKTRSSKRDIVDGEKLTRVKKLIKDDEVEEFDEEASQCSKTKSLDEEHVSEKPRRKSRKSTQLQSGKRSRVKKKIKDEGSEIEDEKNWEDQDSSDEQSSDEEMDSENPRRKSSKGTPRKKKKCKKGPEGKKILTCPHCLKSFYASKGFHYHVDNFVCRPDDRPGGPLQKGKRKSPPEGSANSKKFKRLRGELKDRVCPRCDRVFTSTLGLTYHLEKRVCEKAETRETPYRTLEPGTKALCPFGVVEVVKDDRQTPTADFPADLKQLTRQYLGFKQKREFRENRARNGSLASNLLRRKQMAELYEKGKIDNDSVISVCYEADPRTGEVPMKKRRPDIPPGRPDPSKPEGSFPDRIVECVLIQDVRNRFSGEDCSTKLTKPNLPPTKNPIRLFLRRDALSIYSASADLFLCHICGVSFESKAGWTHHVNQKLCIINQPEIKARNEERMRQVENRALLALDLLKKRGSNKPPPFASGAQKGARLGDSKRSGEGSISDAEDGEFVLTQRAVKKKLFEKPTEKFKDPRVILASLRYEHKLSQSKMIGTMYPGVFRALGFKKATINKKKQKKRKYIIKRIIKKNGVIVGTKMAQGKSLKEAQKRLEAAKAKPVQQPRPVISKPKEASPTKASATPDKAVASGDTNDEFHGVNFNDLPPIIDMRVLVAEVQIGRYPSMRLHKSDVTHDDKCNVCRKGATNNPLVKCGFCTNAFHFSCLLQKFIVKSPEPGDSVMCNSCIQYVMAMRTRAEKRRLEKMGIMNPLPVLQRTQAVVEETKRVIVGKEYECVLAQGRQAADLAEMLQDAQTRFEQAIHTSKADAARRAAILNFGSDLRRESIT